MALDARIVRRTGGRYSFRASVPADLRGVIPGGSSGQKWIALGTADPVEAKRLARLKSVEFDRELESARRSLSGAHTPVSVTEAERLASLWFAYVLRENEERRREGLTERELRAAVESAEISDMGASVALARGDHSQVDYEMREFLWTQGVSVTAGTEDYARVAYAFLRAQKRWAQVASLDVV